MKDNISSNKEPDRGTKWEIYNILLFMEFSNDSTINSKMISMVPSDK